jgi:acyl-CoA synthetase (NDP forming)
MNVLTEVRAEELLSSLVPIAEHTLVRTLAEAREVAHQYPVVLKLISPKALHKSDVGGVVVVHSAFELESRFVSLIQVAKDHNLPLEGILVQEYLVGHEFIIGIKKDPTFGHVVMVGFGGIYVEVLKDISFRVCPIDTNDAVSMVDELLMAPIFQGETIS